MKTVEIIGFKRANLGKNDAKGLRAQGNVPCVLYGGEKQHHFYAPMILFREIVYTPEAAFVNLDIEGEEYKAILQDIQFHPVSEIILHADFLLLQDDKEVKMDIPVRFHGNSPGIQKGGKLMVKLRKLTVKALPKDMPDFIDVSIEELELGKSVKVGDLGEHDYQIMNSKLVSIASVETPRSLRGKSEEEEEAEAAAAAEEAESEEGSSEE